MMRKKAPKRKSKKPATPGRRVGTKRSDMRWEDPNGAVWASRFEYEVWLGIVGTWGAERCVSGRDTLTYTSPVRQARCLGCGGGAVVTDRTYTPDFLVRDSRRRQPNGPCYYIEAKGYLRAEKRRLLRDLRKARPDIDLRFLVERDYKATSSMTILQWIERYMKCPAEVWAGRMPKDWI